MKLPLLMVVAVLSLISVTGRSIAQELDAKQLSLISETASGICDTVSNVSGTNTRVEIEGRVSAELRGLSKSFLDLDAGTNGRFTQESFEGLTQEATATALESAAQCRERLFLVMFEKISAFSPPGPIATELDWRRGLNEMVGSEEGNLPVVRINLQLSAIGAPYNSSKLTEVLFLDMTCKVQLWIDKITIPDRPDGIGGIGLGEVILPKKTISIDQGSSGIALNFHSRLVVDGYRRQQRIALEAGDKDFAAAAKSFRRSYEDWSVSERAWVVLAIASPSEGCKGRYQIRFPASRMDLGPNTELLEM